MSAAHDDRWEAVLNGYLPPVAMGEEELSRRYPRLVRKLMKENPLDANIRRLYEGMVRELYERADEKLSGALLDATDTIIDLSQDLSNDASVRLRAATYLLERVRGKTPEVVEVRQDKPFHLVMEGITTGPRPARAERAALPNPDAPIDAEIVEDPLDEERAFMKNWRRGSLWEQA